MRFWTFTTIGTRRWNRFERAGFGVRRHPMTREQGPCFSQAASLESLSRFRDYIDQTGRQLGVDPGVLADLRLVVDEAVTNVVQHGYQGRPGPVEVRMKRLGDDVVVCIRDQARPFDPGQVPAPQLDKPLADRPYGGMGLYLIRTMTDEAEFRPAPGGGNELRLIRRSAFAGTG